MYCTTYLSLSSFYFAIQTAEKRKRKINETKQLNEAMRSNIQDGEKSKPLPNNQTNSINGWLYECHIN